MSALKSGILAGLFLAISAAFGTFALAAQPTTEFHRQDVDALDKAGWQPAVSTRGDFSIQIPVTFHDYTIHADDENVGKMMVHVIAGRSTEGLKFTVTEMPYTPRMKDPHIADIAGDFKNKPGTKVSDLVQGMHDGAERLSFSVTGGKTGAYMQIIKTKTALYTLALEFPNAERELASDVKSGFFDSFKLKD
jgi:hypothetical protein